MKDISKINQDIENIKSRGKGAKVVKPSNKSSQEEQYKNLEGDSGGKSKEKISLDDKKDGKIKSAADKDNMKNTSDSLNKAKELLTKEQKERQRQMSIISFQPHTLFELKKEKNA
jgi:hypothetical protein